MDMDRLYNNNIIRRICSSICTQIHTHEAVHSTDLYGQSRENEIEMERERTLNTNATKDEIAHNK